MIKTNKSKHGPRKPNEPLADAVRERFAQKLAAGYTQSAAWRETHPQSKAKDSVVHAKASMMASEDDVRQRKAEILADMIPSTVLTRVQLLEMISDELRDTRSEPGALSAAASLVDKFCKIMGYYADEKITLRNGGYAQDYKGPPSLADLTDEQLRERLKEIRGEE